jgi:hypothetical protein
LTKRTEAQQRISWLAADHHFYFSFKMYAPYQKINADWHPLEQVSIHSCLLKKGLECCDFSLLWLTLKIKCLDSRS